jgi:hypothetical protein
MRFYYVEKQSSQSLFVSLIPARDFPDFPEMDIRKSHREAGAQEFIGLLVVLFRRTLFAEVFSR